jgi:hypothetical protein
MHDTVPTLVADRPAQYWDVPLDKREEDVFLTSDSCVIADKFFFIRGCLEVPIIGTSEIFSWGVWVSLKEENFFTWQENYKVAQRSHIGPFFGWLSTCVPGYPETVNLKTMAHLRDNGIRPYIELEKTEHPLALEQCDGITSDRVQEILDENGVCGTDSK